MHYSRGRPPSGVRTRRRSPSADGRRRLNAIFRSSHRCSLLRPGYPYTRGDPLKTQLQPGKRLRFPRLDNQEFRVVTESFQLTAITAHGPDSLIIRQNKYNVRFLSCHIFLPLFSFFDSYTIFHSLWKQRLYGRLKSFDRRIHVLSSYRYCL